jgi:hypothetical protein
MLYTGQCLWSKRGVMSGTLHRTNLGCNGSGRRQREGAIGKALHLWYHPRSGHQICAHSLGIILHALVLLWPVQPLFISVPLQCRLEGSSVVYWTLLGQVPRLTLYKTFLQIRMTTLQIEMKANT